MKKEVTIESVSILVVDDVKSMRSIVRSMLKNMKISRPPFMAENGLEGLRIMHANPIDIAIIDWKMPVMNGSQMLEAIRSDRYLRDTPVIMVTAESEKDIVLEAAEIEVDAYLLKPLKPSVLEEKIRTLIDHINHPDKATLHVRKSRQLEESGELDTAIRHMEAAIKLKPGASRLLRKAALLYQQLGDESTTRKYLVQAADANPQDAVTRYLLGELFRKKKNLLPATRYYRETLELTRKFNSSAVELGNELMQAGEPGHAKQIFSQVISKQPKDTDIAERIIDACIENKEYAFALNLLKQLIRDFPSNTDLVFQTALVCEMMEDIESALEHFLTVDKNQYNHVEAKLKIATMYYKKDKVLQADNYLNAVLKIDPDNKEALALRRLL